MNSALAALDEALANGPEITLRRVIGAGANIVNVDCTGVKARINAFKPEQLIGGITQDYSLVIISPTQILEKQWPPVAAAKAQYPQYPWLPQKNDKAIIAGRERIINFVKPFDPEGEVVRIELTVAG